METNTSLALACLAATRAGAGCAIAEGRNRAMAGSQGCGGKSIIEMLWDELLNQYELLMVLNAAASHRMLKPGEHDEAFARRGTCLGLAKALAILVNPYRPDVDAIRTECVERYKAIGEQEPA